MTTATDDEVKVAPMRLLEASSVKPGDIIQVIHYAKVVENNGFSLKVGGLDGTIGTFDVIGVKLINHLGSADHYVEEVEVTKTEMIQILMRSYNTPFTVVYDKQEPTKPKKGEVLDESKAGIERVLRGTLVGPEPEFGRSLVQDLDLPLNPDRPDSRMRRVDHRTMKALIVGLVLYIDKSLSGVKRTQVKELIKNRAAS